MRGSAPRGGWSAASGAATAFLPPQAVARLANLDLIARHVVEGYIAGLHRSPFHGFSSEFSQHRPYRPGDDLRRLDWGVWGRTERLYVKQFEEETNLVATILLDISRSMDYPRRTPPGEVDKSFYSRALAACMAHLLLRQRDAVGLTCFAERIHTRIPSSSRPSHRRALLAALEGARPVQAETALESALHESAERRRRRGLVLLITDLQDCDPEGVERGLHHLRHRGHRAILLWVLHPREIDLELRDDVVLRDLESGRLLKSHGPEARTEARQLLQERRKRWAAVFGATEVDWACLRTDEPFALALGTFLRGRARIRL